MSNSLFRVDWPELDSKAVVDIRPEDAIDKMNQSLEAPEVNTFDIIGHLALVYLEKSYNGELVIDRDFIAGKQDSVAFKKSPFYQSMRNDLRGTLFLTSKQYRRAAERVLSFLGSKVTDTLSFEKIISILEGFCLEQEFIRKDEKKISQQPTSPIKSEDRSHPSSYISPSVLSSSIQSHSGGQKYDISPASHAFLAVHGEHSVIYCEYCFDLTLPTDELKLYTCEMCGVNIHKGCRGYMTLSCMKTSFEGAKEESMDLGTEAMRIVTEKLAALQKEIDIEIQIREGLEKIVKAKKPAKAGKKTPFEIDIAAQLEKNTKRLDGLKHEMQKRTVQLQTMQSQAAILASAPVSVLDPGSTDLDRPLTLKSILSKSLGTLNSLTDNDSQDTGLLRVAVIDPVTKLPFKKAVYITENQSTLEVIEIILQKSNLSGNALEFSLSYKDPNSEEQIILKDEDRPTQIEYLNYANTLFYLQSQNLTVPLPAEQDHDNVLMKKQLEIITEIIESEAKYTDDLKLVHSIFVEPLAEISIITEADGKELFINIDDITPIHEKICEEISRTFPTNQEKVSNLINCYLEHIDKFSIYQEYCGGQYQQRELIKRLLAQNLPFGKFIQKCESHPKLHKLGLLDMLMKPMQKITRYPLLFKRLLPNLQAGTDDYENLTILISNLEGAIFKVNEAVRHMESRYRIKMIDKTMDFGMVSEKFQISIDDRQLLMENTLLYINEKADTSIEVVVLLFNDILLITRRSKKVVGGYVLYKPPIPLEQVLFLDQSEEESKKWFQIAHLKQDIHILQAYSVFDKKSWLQEADSVKEKFVDMLYKFEREHMKFASLKITKSIAALSSPHPLPVSKSSQGFPDESNHSSYRGSYFFSNPKPAGKKQSEDAISLVSTPEEFQSNRQRGHAASISEVSAIAKLSSEELLNGKKKLAGGYIRRESIKAEISESPKVTAEDLVKTKKSLRASFFGGGKRKVSPNEENSIAPKVTAIATLAEHDDEEKDQSMTKSMSKSSLHSSSREKGSSINLMSKLRKKVLESIRKVKKDDAE